MERQRPGQSAPAFLFALPVGGGCLSLIENARVEGFPFVGFGIDVEVLGDLLAGGFAHCVSFRLRHAHCSQHGLCKRLRVFWWNDGAVGAGEFRDTADICGNERFLHRHGFAQDEGQAFPRGTEDEGVTMRERARHVV